MPAGGVMTVTGEVRGEELVRLSRRHDTSTATSPLTRACRQHRHGCRRDWSGQPGTCGARVAAQSSMPPTRKGLAATRRC